MATFVEPQYRYPNLWQTRYDLDIGTQHVDVFGTPTKQIPSTLYPTELSRAEIVKRRTHTLSSPVHEVLRVQLGKQYLFFSPNSPTRRHRGEQRAMLSHPGACLRRHIRQRTGRTGGGIRPGSPWFPRRRWRAIGRWLRLEEPCRRGVYL